MHALKIVKLMKKAHTKWLFTVAPMHFTGFSQRIFRMWVMRINGIIRMPNIDIQIVKNETQNCLDLSFETASFSKSYKAVACAATVVVKNVWAVLRESAIYELAVRYSK